MATPATSTRHDVKNATTDTKSSNADHLPGPWAKTYKAKTKEELLQAYSEWCGTYDEDSIEKFGYVAPRRAAEELARHLSSSVSKKTASSQVRVADVGAGTGLVGTELFHQWGYSNLAALDYSSDMLQVAKSKGCYKELICVDLDDPPEVIFAKHGPKGKGDLGLRANSFVAAISVGTFTPHHVGIEALMFVILLVEPGGILTLSLRDDFVADSSNGFQRKLEELEESGILRRLHVTNPELYTAKVSGTIYFRCWTFLVTKNS